MAPLMSFQMSATDFTDVVLLLLLPVLEAELTAPPLAPPVLPLPVELTVDDVLSAPANASILKIRDS